MLPKLVPAGLIALACSFLFAVPTANAAGVPRAGHAGHGDVYAPWPRNENGKPPKQKLARKLARQVGPTKVRKRHRHGGRAHLSGWSGRETAPAPLRESSSANGKLYLVRSFDIPPTDKLYKDLVNYSFTYDNGLAALAFVASHNKGQSMQLLDQLAELQNDDGSLYFAYDVRTGASADAKRSGAIAWAGLAAAAYSRRYESDRYDRMIAGIVGYLMKLRNSAGLITGGPDVSWASTQHNLLAAALMRDLEGQTEAGKGSTIGGYGPEDFKKFTAGLDEAIMGNLFVDDDPLAYFVQGQKDSRIPVDVQSFGAMYLQAVGDERAARVADFLRQPEFQLGPREAADKAGVVSGLRPYFDEDGPNVIWSEGTIEAGLALSVLGTGDKAISSGISSLAATMSGRDVGPIGADRNIQSDWGEYHTWPTSAAASWLLMLRNADDLTLFSP